VTPHLTYTSPTGVRANDNPITTTITGFGDTLGTANSTVPNGTNFITAGGAGGRVIMNPDGTFIFYPDAGDNNASGTVTFFYTITGGDTAQVTLTFEAEEFIWFVDGSGACTVGTGTNVGTQACPATDVPTVAAVDTANDVIFVADGNYTCGMLATGIALETGEWIIGDGSSNNLGALIASRVSPVAGSNFAPYSTFSGTDPVFNSSSGDCFTLTSNNEIRGLRIDNTTGYAIASAVNIGTSTAVEVNVTGTGGILNLVGGGTFNGTFETLSSTSHTGRVINLTNMAGIITNTDGTITNAANTTTIAIGGGTLSMTLASSVSKTAGTGNLLTVIGAHTGTLTFTNAMIQNSALSNGILF
ncbi:MAG: hypothetical protein KJ043_23350, partial [Anaerolineae bacterium]|nr:hypothetical protein [Anaerolineae bacterium]